jgi:CheY-like chemotaxis protein
VPHTILCVDDDIETLRMRQAILEESVYSVLTASSGDEALRIAADSRNIDLVLLDYVMPGMDGEQVARKLKEEFPEVPILVISGIRIPVSFLNNVNGYIQKGHDPDVLLTAVAGLLQNHESEVKEIPATQTPRKTILCVDDEDFSLLSRRAVFESAGFNVIMARGAREALEIFKTRSIQIVVSDYWMSEMNGVALAEELKRISPNTPVVVLSGFGSLPGEAPFVDAWLIKSRVEPEELLEVVGRLTESRSSGR